MPDFAGQSELLDHRYRTNPDKFGTGGRVRGFVRYHTGGPAIIIAVTLAAAEKDVSDPAIRLSLSCMPRTEFCKQCDIQTVRWGHMLVHIMCLAWTSRPSITNDDVPYWRVSVA